MKAASITCLVATLAVAAAGNAAPIDNPMGYFNAYSLGDIGSASAKYHSDIQGIAGAAGDVYFSSFSLHGNDSTSGYSLHTGGSATLTGSYHKSLEIGADARLGSLSVSGSVVAGGDISNFSGGSIGGDAIAAGNVLLSPTLTVQGAKHSGAQFSALVDHAALSDYFTDFSDQVGAMTPTVTVTNSWGMLRLNAGSGVNVATIDAATLRSAWGFAITAPSDAIVYINVPDASVNLDWTGWVYSGGVSAGDVLLNMPSALDLNLTSANKVNILAPYADAYFPSGMITGSLVVGDLQGGGQINVGHFDHAPAVPEPATLSLLAIGALIIRTRKQ